jgi:hypothetical protein
VALGSYPSVNLPAARKARNAAKAHKAEGRDPVQVREIEKLKATRSDGDTFKAIALEWYGKQAPQWSEAHASRMLRQFERDLFPWIPGPAGARDRGHLQACAAGCLRRWHREPKHGETADGNAGQTTCRSGHSRIRAAGVGGMEPEEPGNLEALARKPSPPRCVVPSGRDARYWC